MHLFTLSENILLHLEECDLLRNCQYTLCIQKTVYMPKLK